MNRDRQAKWDANHLTTIATKLPVQQADDLKLHIGQAGYPSVYAFLQDIIAKWELEDYNQAHRRRKEENMKTVDRLP